MYEGKLKKSWKDWHEEDDYLPVLPISMARGFKAGLSAVQDSVVDWRGPVTPQAVVARMCSSMQELDFELLHPDNNEENIKDSLATVLVQSLLMCEKLGIEMHELIHSRWY